MRLFSCLFTCFLLSAALRAGDDAAKADLKLLQGTWKVVEAFDKGERVPDEGIKNMEIVFEGSKILVRERGKVQDRMTVHIDAGKKPKTMDLTHTEGPDKDKTDHAIYLLEGDSLKICVNEKSGEARPTEFVSKPGTTHSLIVLKRAK